MTKSTASGWKSQAGKDYRKYLKSLKKTTTAVKTDQLVKYSTDRMLGKIDWEKKSKRLKLKDYIKKSPEALRKTRLYQGAKPLSTALRVVGKLGKRTGIGKAVAAATVVAGAYEAGKRKLFTKDKKKKKVQKKSTGGEIIIGRGVDLDLL